MGRFLRRTSRRGLAALSLTASLALLAGAAPDPFPMPTATTPPADPSPSLARVSIAYPHGSVRRTQFGTGAKSYWLFEPDDPRPEIAPVIGFHHGWLAVNPGVYGAWIEHMVRGGCVVVAPRYQADWATRPVEFLPNALAALGDAFDVLQGSPSHVKPDRDRFALIGHSAGGNLSAQVAAVAEEHGLPRPKALVLIAPGEVKPLRGPSLALIPASTLMVVAVVEHDMVVGDLRARQIFAEATALPPSHKRYVLFRTDRHGLPHLVADHFAATAALPCFDTGDGLFNGVQMTGADLNALDFRGFWRLADLTLDAGFAGRTLDEAIGVDSPLCDLGRWDDGHAVLPPLVSTDPDTLPRVHPTNGVRLIPWPTVGPRN